MLQPENRLIDLSVKLKLIRKGNLSEVLKIYNMKSEKYLLGNEYPYVTEKKICDVGHSLVLVKVKNLEINQVEIEEKPKTKVNFIYNYIKYNSISVTDPTFYSVADKTKYEEAYLVVSIGTPYKEDKYYKFVASIFV